ncbi:Root phototropism protein 3-like [Quillaja saponaria]|uniref:Root phototropism protein 3-like n=1 Tax=Quillaja saponaria TaxID=32244 RepID=A0AAD7VJL9_QUISA|nr:Root phototropism protein 3-like [Quillaja saponaria]
MFKLVKKRTQNLKREWIPWWFEDVSFLRIDHFVEVIQSIRRLGMRSEIIGSCIAHWTTKWLSRITFRLDSVIPIQITHQLQRVTTECLIKILPTEEHSVSVTFLLHLLQASLMLKINPELLYVLERRIAVLLERCQVPDILVKNCEDNDTLYDVDIVTRVLEAYVSCILSNPAAKRYAVGRLVDGYLIIVARDENLTVTSFQSLVEALPQNVRYCDDNLYRAIDIYLKAHPNLAEEERTSVCKVLEYHRLSQEARQHVMRNDRLPSKMTTQFILLEQVNMTRSMTSTGSNYRRTKTQAIIRVSKSLEKGRKNSQEIKMMRKEVDTMKVQLNELHVCKLKLQKQLLRCIH